jgi:RNA polymerase sigma-70 factor, ECF subfamily
MNTFPLADAFRAHKAVEVALPASDAELERVLVDAVNAARAHWGEVNVPPERFAGHLAGRLPPTCAGRPVSEALEQVRVAELYLAFACALELPAALHALEENYLRSLPAMLSHLKVPDATLDEVCQRLRVHLLVRDGAATPRIAEFAGRGTLASWIRVAATREALKLKAGEHAGGDDAGAAALEALPAQGRDPELDLIRRRYARELRQALAAAVATLTADQRHLLLLYFGDRLSTTALGKLFGVNQSTASRWLQALRQSLYEATKLNLKERLGLSSRDFESLLAVLDSQFELSISQFLEAEDTPK